jgi:ribose 1,5-bisphosphokinase PhnN
MEPANRFVCLAARAAKTVVFAFVVIFFVALGAGGFAYLWQAKKLQYTWQAELDKARTQGRLTEDQYIAQLRSHSYTKALLSPEQVLHGNWQPLDR